MYISITEQTKLAEKMKVKDKYPIGCKVKATYINDEWVAMYTNMVAEVTNVDSIGQLTCKTKDGYVFKICEFYGDVIEKVEEA